MSAALWNNKIIDVYPDQYLGESTRYTWTICQFLKANPSTLAKVLGGKKVTVHLTNFIDKRPGNYRLSLSHLDSDEQIELHNESVQNIVNHLYQGKRVAFIASCYKVIPRGHAHLQLRVHKIDYNIPGEQLGNIGVKIKEMEPFGLNKLLIIYSIFFVAFLVISYFDQTENNKI